MNSELLLLIFLCNCKMRTLLYNIMIYFECIADISAKYILICVEASVKLD